MEITGIVLNVWYSSGDFSSILLDGIDPKVLKDAGLKPGPAKAAGNIASPEKGMLLRLLGEWTEHPKYGKQFKAYSSEAVVTGSLPSIRAYLASGNIKGVGPKLADKIVLRFGKDTIRIIETEPMRLTELKGISAKRAEAIAESHKNAHAYIRIYEYFKGNITEHQVKTLFSRYGEKTVEKLRENPYRLIYDLDGFAFKRTDALAKNSGIHPSDPRRTCAAIVYLLKSMAEDGHCYCTVDSLEGNLLDIIPDGIQLSQVADCLLEERKRNHLVIEGDSIYLKSLYDAETGFAAFVKGQLEAGPAKTAVSHQIEKAVRDIEAKTGFELERKQREAVRCALSNGISVITGGPGVGKTTITQAVIRAWGDDETVLLAAPTGRASRRMAEITGPKAQTIHKWIQKIKFSKRKYTKMLVIVDEASMLDVELAYRFTQCLDRCNLVLVGDVDQLPPIGPGNPFRDLVSSPYIPKVTLDVSHRQGGNIAANAEKINSGMGIHAYKFDQSFQFLQKEKETVQESVIREYCRMAEEYGLENTQCIVPIRKKDRSVTAMERLNPILRDILNPVTEAMREQLIPGLDFRPGDRVMQTENDSGSDTYNGDCGFIRGIDPDSKLVTIHMDDGRDLDFSLAEMKSFSLSYAITIHKSQGSEYRGVVIACSMEHWRVLQRNLLYTAVTRAKEKVVLVGEARAVNAAVKKVPAITRNTHLLQRLR